MPCFSFWYKSRLFGSMWPLRFSDILWRPKPSRWNAGVTFTSSGLLLTIHAHHAQQTSSYLAFYLHILTSTVNFQQCTDLLTKVLCTNTYKSWLRSKADTTTSWSLSSCSNHYDTITMGWHGGATVGRRTCNQEVASSIHRQTWLRNDSGQVVHTQLPWRWHSSFIESLNWVPFLLYHAICQFKYAK